MSHCNQCPDLAANRRRIVPGTGDLPADIMFIGQCPGIHGADLTGIPFLGDKSGDLFRSGLATLRPAKIYITNVVKCASPDNREPTDTEIQNCSKFLEMELDQARPKLVVTIGRLAANRFFYCPSILESCNRPVRAGAHTILPLVHPAHCLRIGNDSLFIEGFKKIRRWQNGEQI